MNIPPIIYVAGPNLNDPSINRSSRMPPRQAPIAEPAEPGAVSREADRNAAAIKNAVSTSTGIEQPISLPNSNGRMDSSAKAGSTLNLRA